MFKCKIDGCDFEEKRHRGDIRGHIRRDHGIKGPDITDEMIEGTEGEPEEAQLEHQREREGVGE